MDVVPLTTSNAGGERKKDKQTTRKTRAKRGKTLVTQVVSVC